MRVVVVTCALLAVTSTASAKDHSQRLQETYPDAAEVISHRVNQKRAKMKLTAAEGERAAKVLLELLESSKPLRQLVAVMPHSSVELARAVDERDLPRAEADAIADYLFKLVTAIDFARLEQFDRNHSHVTGRQWREIDYSGERMTWRGQKKYWSARGVHDFKTVAHIDAYMRAAARMRHWKRVYRPRKKISSFVYQPSKR